MPVSADDAALVLAVRGGDESAFAVLFERWSDRCFDVARRIVRDDGAAAEVTQDVFLVAWRQLDTLRDPAAFGGWVLRASRNKALNRLERERRSQPVALDAPLLLDRTDGTSAASDAEAAMTAGDLQELVSAASAVLGERDASVLDLHLRHGLGAAEIATELDVTTNNAHQMLFRMKKNLAAGVRAWVLVKGGRASCEGLRVSLEAAGIERFGKDAARVIDRHVTDCDDCSRRQAAVLDPAALFAAAPLLVMAPALRNAVASGLQADGVPVPTQGATTAPPPGGAPTDPQPPDEPDGVDRPDDPAGPGSSVVDAGSDPRRRRWAVLALLAAVIAVIVGLGVAASDGEEDVVATGTSVPSTLAAITTDPAPDDEPAATTSTTKVLPALTSSTTAGTLVITPRTSAPPADAPATVPPSSFQPNDPSPPAPAPPAATTTTIAPPRVDAFTATLAGAPDGDCPPGQWATTLAWSTTRATSVRITATTVTTLSGLPADGSTIVCRSGYGAPPGGWHLTATGPGGSTAASA